MSSVQGARSVDAERRRIVALSAVNALGLLGPAAAAMVFSGPTSSAKCDVYCGPASNMVLAFVVLVIACAVWLAAVLFDLAVVIAGQPRRRWAILAFALQAVPVALVLVRASALG